jgi:hypothetical protein
MLGLAGIPSAWRGPTTRRPGGNIPPHRRLNLSPDPDHPAERPDQATTRKTELPDAFSGKPVALADLIQGAGLAIGKPKSQPENAGLALGVRGQHGLHVVAQQRERDGV